MATRAATSPQLHRRWAEWFAPRWNDVALDEDRSRFVTALEMAYVAGQRNAHPPTPIFRYTGSGQPDREEGTR